MPRTFNFLREMFYNSFVKILWILILEIGTIEYGTAFSAFGLFVVVSFANSDTHNYVMGKNVSSGAEYPCQEKQKQNVIIDTVYWTVHHLDSWIKIDQLDVTCFIISPFTAQHVSNVSTSIFRSLQLIVDLFHVLYCSGSMCVGVTVWFGWGGVVPLRRLKH